MQIDLHRECGLHRPVGECIHHPLNMSAMIPVE